MEVESIYIKLFIGGMKEYKFNIGGYMPPHSKASECYCRACTGGARSRHRTHPRPSCRARGRPTRETPLPSRRQNPGLLLSSGSARRARPSGPSCEPAPRPPACWGPREQGPAGARAEGGPGGGPAARCAASPAAPGTRPPGRGCAASCSSAVLLLCCSLH